MMIVAEAENLDASELVEDNFVLRAALLASTATWSGQVQLHSNVLEALNC